jgi:hypothetical protein
MATSNKNNWKDREIGALWKRKSEKGTYCTGYIMVEEMGTQVKQRVVMFSAKEKKNDKAPDLIIYKSVDQEEDQGQTPQATAAAKPAPAKAAPKAAAAPRRQPAPPPPQEDEPVINDDDIPM